MLSDQTWAPIAKPTTKPGFQGYADIFGVSGKRSNGSVSVNASDTTVESKKWKHCPINWWCPKRNERSHHSPRPLVRRDSGLLCHLHPLKRRLFKVQFHPAWTCHFLLRFLLWPAASFIESDIGPDEVQIGASWARFLTKCDPYSRANGFWNHLCCMKMGYRSKHLRVLPTDPGEVHVEPYGNPKRSYKSVYILHNYFTSIEYTPLYASNEMKTASCRSKKALLQFKPSLRRQTPIMAIPGPLCKRDGSSLSISHSTTIHGSHQNLPACPSSSHKGSS